PVLVPFGSVGADSASRRKLAPTATLNLPAGSLKAVPATLASIDARRLPALMVSVPNRLASDPGTAPAARANGSSAGWRTRPLFSLNPGATRLYLPPGVGLPFAS